MLLQEKVIDEFGIILLGAIILLFGLAFFAISTKQQLNITSNASIEVLTVPYIKLDTINRRITILEKEGSIFKSLFSEREEKIPLRISKEELNNIEKINLYFETEKNLSKVYLVFDKNVYEVFKEIPKEFAENSYLLIKIEEFDYTIYTVLVTIYIISCLILYAFYKKYYIFEIKILFLAISIIFIAVLIIFGNKKVSDKYNLKVDILTKSFTQKDYEFNFSRTRRNVTLYFEIENAIQTVPLKILLNDDILYNNKPFTNKVNISKEINLKEYNTLRIIIEGEAYYELKNLRLIVGPARS